uniref:Uncharacterized protein n=1 Tax=Trichobilharzia regenti TaxID=157069 RepID=A0AA85JA57_TRIRE|nr:unnamed protein product [Trichobilharzia regenti]
MSNRGSSFINPSPIWKSSSLSQHQQKNSVGFSIQTSGQSVLLYGSETWRVTKNVSSSLLQTSINNSLRSLCTEDQMAGPERITNKKLWLRTNKRGTNRQPTNMQEKVETDCTLVEEAGR